MNLNQAAHGDREFGYIQARLGMRAQDRRRPRVGPARVAARVGAWARAAAGWAATRSLKLARFGDNMRYVAVTEGDKTEAELRFGVQVNTWGVNDLVDAVDAATDADVDALVAEYEDATTSCRSFARRGRGTSRCATAPRSSSACARSSRRAASARSPPPSRTWAG